MRRSLKRNMYTGEHLFRILKRDPLLLSSCSSPCFSRQRVLETIGMTCRNQETDITFESAARYFLFSNLNNTCLPPYTLTMYKKYIYSVISCCKNSCWNIFEEFLSFHWCKTEFTDLNFVKIQFVWGIYQLLHLFHLSHLLVCLCDKLQTIMLTMRDMIRFKHVT